MGSSRKEQTGYWDRIRQATGQQETTTNEEHDYWQLQRNQETIGWDNLLRGKFAKDWRKLNGVHNIKQKRYPTTNRESPAGTRKNKRGAREGAGSILGSDETNEEEEDNGGTTGEEDMKSGCIPAVVRRHHTDYSGTMVKA